MTETVDPQAEYTANFLEDLNWREVVDTLKNRRLEMEYTAEDVGGMLGLAGQTVLNWENRSANPTLANLRRWTRALDMRLSMQLDGPIDEE